MVLYIDPTNPKILRIIGIILSILGIYKYIHLYLHSQCTEYFWPK